MWYYRSVLFLVIFLVACGPRQQDESIEQEGVVRQQVVAVPEFKADSAYWYVEKQVAFGPRVPGSESSHHCASWLVDKMKSFGLTVQVQQGKVRAYDGKLLEMKNIVAAYNPASSNRVLLCAHWDSRPFADWDPDEKNHNKPIPGANDGASGVGVLLEVARHIASLDSAKGVDFVFFDCEDYGKPKGTQHSKVANDWGLGSQHWAGNPHLLGYSARYGILLDMVGAKDAVFTMEGTSMFYAPDIMKRVWDAGHRLGYGRYFSYERTSAITDDHLYVNQYLQIPTIDIIHHDPAGATGFFEHWHTIHDDMSSIDRETLKAVGQTLMEVVFRGL